MPEHGVRSARGCVRGQKLCPRERERTKGCGNDGSHHAVIHDRDGGSPCELCGELKCARNIPLRSGREQSGERVFLPNLWVLIELACLLLLAVEISGELEVAKCIVVSLPHFLPFLYIRQHFAWGYVYTVHMKWPLNNG